MERFWSFQSETGGERFGTQAAALPLAPEASTQNAEQRKDLVVPCARAYIAPPLDEQSPSSWSDLERARSLAPSSLQPSYNESWNEQEDALQLPTQTRHRVYKWLRWNFLSVYRRLFSIVFMTNLVFLLYLGIRAALGKSGITRYNTIAAASVNLAVSILVRNEHVVNTLFLLSSSMQPSNPLAIRRRLAKIYHYGGIHSGCATAAVAWYLTFAGLVAYESFRGPFVDIAMAILTSCNVIALLTITVLAHPFLRARLHDWFECTHRFAGWLAVSLFWAQTILIANRIRQSLADNSLAKALITAPAFWWLILITLCIAYPWTRLRRRSCFVERLSPHAVRLHFSHKTIPHCSAVRLATSPLKATHAFAAIPNCTADGKGFSVVISNAGDWTSQIIAGPPRALWIKGAPFYGVLRVALMFKPVLIVATGSGIGPCLSLFHGAPDLDCRVLWSTRSPLETYGEQIISDVLRADAGAVVVDTRKTGRPDLVRLTYEVYKGKGCEAVVIISNAGATKQVVYGMEARGIPAYGPIFDS